jgi:hypothetical protein
MRCSDTGFKFVNGCEGFGGRIKRFAIVWIDSEHESLESGVLTDHWSCPR